MPFLANEDTALKKKLQGLFVHDATSGTSGRPVTVRFKNPEYELSDSQYPLIMISHTMISKDAARESRGYVRVGYAPEGYAPWADMSDPRQSPYSSEMPIPLNIDYRVDVYTRKQTHMIELTGVLMGYFLLADRYGFLTIPQDGTTRRLDILGGPEYVESKDELGKRLFSAAWSVRVSSEIFLYEIEQLPPTLRVIIAKEDLASLQNGYVKPLDPPTEVTAEKLVVTTSALPAGVVGTPYRQPLAATGGTGPYFWSLQNGSLPAGLNLTPGGIVFGTPTVATPSPPQAFTVACTDDSLYAPQQVPQLVTLAITGS